MLVKACLHRFVTDVKVMSFAVKPMETLNVVHFLSTGGFGK